MQQRQKADGASHLASRFAAPPPSPPPSPPTSARSVTTAIGNASALTEDAPPKRRQGSGPRLTDAARLEILALLAAPPHPPLRELARQFGVSEAAIRHVRDRAAIITSRALAAPEHVRRRTRRAAQQTFPELEAQLGAWLDAHGSTSTAGDTESSALTHRAEEIAARLGLGVHEFRASASWLKGFQRRRRNAPTTGSVAIPSQDRRQEGTTAAPGEKRKRGAGPRLSDSQRLEILQQLQRADAPSNRKLAAAYNVDEATIRRVKANAEAIRVRTLNAPLDVRQRMFRAGKAAFAELETILATWIDASRRCNAEIPPAIVRRKAEEVARELEIADGEFKASMAWYTAFCRRQGLGPISPVNDLEQIVAAYAPKDVFTVDETGLFYRLLPHHDTLIPSADPDANAKALARVSLVLCCNVTGTERLPVSMISKDAAPRCKAPSSQWPLPYFHQTKAWMDTKVFAEWFDEVFKRHVGRDRKVLLLLDDAPGHPLGFESGNIRVLALHSASRSWTPPLTMGVIAGLKNRYKLRILSDVLAYHALSSDMKQRLALDSKLAKNRPAGVFFGRMPHLLDAAYRIVDAWAEISSELLRFSFEKTGFVSQLKNGVNASRSSCSSSDGQHAMRIEAEERMVEEDMLQMLQRFYQDRCHWPQEPNESSDPAFASTLASELQVYLHLDDDTSAVYQKCIADDIDGVLGGATNSEVDDEEPHDVSETTWSTMDRALISTPSSRNANGVVSLQDVLATSTLLGMQLRQLQASSALDAQQIERAVQMLDRFRHELQTSASRNSSAGGVQDATPSNPASTTGDVFHQVVS